MSDYIIHNGVIYAPDELMHYGVMGMKWGQRRARKQGKDYQYTSHGTKKYKRKYEKARAKGNVEKAKKYLNMHKRSVEMDKRMQKNALATSGGKYVGKLLVNGVWGGRTYEAVKASFGASKNTNRVAGVVAANMTGPFGASLARALYVRNKI